MPSKITSVELIRMKERGEKIVVMTCYDFPSALLMEDAGIDIIFVGDSLGSNVLGYESTLFVTMEETLHHCKAVRRGIKDAMFLADMPFMSIQPNADEAVRNAGRLVKEAGVEAVKLEGGEEVAPTIKRIVQAGIPVMGHIGMMPQHMLAIGGFKVTGKTEADRLRLLSAAEAIQDAGAFALLLELVDAETAAMISESLRIPTIGIGAGVNCDGQVQVFHDLVGFYPGEPFRHASRYTNIADSIGSALKGYAADVRSGNFRPGIKHE